MHIIKEKTGISFSMQDERKLWNECFSNGLLPIPQNCPNCHHNISIIENNTLINPYISQCTSSKCRKKIYLRVSSLFEKFPKKQISLIFYVIKMSLIHETNGSEIFELFRQIKSPIDLSKNHIFSILDYLRYIISHYIKDTYKLERIAEQNAYDSISIDESLFTHDGINQMA